nr:hypothetical protein [Oscillochloris trichoides]
MSEKYVKIQNQDARSGAPLSPMVAEGQEKILPRASELTYFSDSISVFDLLSIIPVMLFTAKPDGTWNYINPSLSSFFWSLFRYAEEIELD